MNDSSMANNSTTGAAPDPTTPISRWSHLSQKRVAFFARHETFFLYLLTVPMLIAAVVLLFGTIAWITGQGTVLESYLHVGQWRR